MPLKFLKKKEDWLEIGVWESTEKASWYIGKLSFFPEEIAELALLVENKKCEWLSSRYLLHLMSGREVRGKVLKDTFGKPYLADSTWHISLSHSKNFASIAACEYPVGVDVQWMTPKIIKIARRFMSEFELKNLNDNNHIEKAHVYWGAKESLFKLYGKGKLDFRKQLIIHNFDYTDSGSTSGKIITKHECEIHCHIGYTRVENYILVWAYYLNDDKHHNILG